MYSRKIIKKLVKIAALLLLIFITLPFVAFFLLQNSQVQTFVAGNITKIISRNLNTEVSLGKVNISFPYRLKIHDLYLEDIYGDTLIYSESLIAGIRNLNPVNHSISLGSVDLNKASVRLYIDSTRTVNIKYLVNHIKSNKQGDGKWDVSFNNIRLNNSKFHLYNFYYSSKENGINFKDLLVTNLEADIKQFTPGKDSLSFRINSLSFNESSGFAVKNLAADFSQSKKFLIFRKFWTK